MLLLNVPELTAAKKRHLVASRTRAAERIRERQRQNAISARYRPPFSSRRMRETSGRAGRGGVGRGGVRFRRIWPRPCSCIDFTFDTNRARARRGRARGKMPNNKGTREKNRKLEFSAMGNNRPSGARERPRARRGRSRAFLPQAGAFTRRASPLSPPPSSRNQLTIKFRGFSRREKKKKTASEISFSSSRGEITPAFNH